MSETISGEANTSEDADSSDDPAADGVHMMLWTRRPVCGARTEVIDRLSALRSSGLIGEFTVKTWPDEVVLTEHTEQDPVVEIYETFRRWSGNHGVSISPPFERRTVTSLVGQSREVLTVPVLCLAVYEGDDLCGVYPCTDGARTYTVTEYLDAYEAAGGRPPDGEALAVIDG